MPTNLNALIRYKTIDKCLRNRYVKCDIDYLREACSEALGEFRGIYTPVSERTIRGDIHDMRSEILGFNAPIMFDREKRCYKYSDPDYSIFSVTVFDIELMKKILNLLLENRQLLKGNGSSGIILELARLTKTELPGDVLKALEKSKESEEDTGLHFYATEIKEPEATYNEEAVSYQKDKAGTFQWGVILEIL